MVARISARLGVSVSQEGVRVARIEQRQHVGMLQVGGDLDRLAEPLGASHGGQLGPEDLHGDLPVVLQILGDGHGGHATRAEFFLAGAAVGESGFERVQKA